jgi:20S proteasome alpha/beta subunit
VEYPVSFLEEEFPMTIQIGMVATDGLLVASDTRTMMSPQWANSGAPRVTFNATKIRISPERGIIVSSARNMETANHLATEIIENLKEEDFEWPIFPIEGMARKVLAAAPRERNDAQCLVAIMHPTPRLFLFQYAMVNGVWGPMCQKMEGKAIAGDNINAAAFWAERYYERRPIEELIPLAAHLIISASKLNSGAISGLEIVICTSTEIKRLSDDSIRTLERQCTKWDEDIGNSFLAYRQQFS